MLVSGISSQAKAIQQFQSIHDKQAGKWNHSAIHLQTYNDFYVVEEAPIENRKIKASGIITPLMHYTDQIPKGMDLLYLVPKFEFNEVALEQILMKHIGVPYDYKSLLGDQIIRTLSRNGEFWLGRKGEKAARRMVCHEFVQHVWHEYSKEHMDRILFPDWWKGDVAHEYYSPDFEHKNMIPYPFDDKQ